MRLFTSVLQSSREYNPARSSLGIHSSQWILIWIYETSFNKKLQILIHKNKTNWLIVYKNCLEPKLSLKSEWPEKTVSTLKKMTHFDVIFHICCRHEKSVSGLCDTP